MYLLSKYKQKMVIKVCPLIKSNLNLFFASDTIEWTMKSLFLCESYTLDNAPKLVNYLIKVNSVLFTLTRQRNFHRFFKFLGKKWKRLKDSLFNIVYLRWFVNLEKHSHMANDFQPLKVTRIKRLSLINLLDLHKTVWYIFPLILRRMVSTFEYLSQQHGFESNYLHNLFYTFTPWPHRYQSQRGHKDLIAPT